MAIKKNDIVTNNKDIRVGSPSNPLVIPAGTQLRVWKATRRGTLFCNAVDRSLSYYTVNAYATDVTKVEQPKPNVNVGDIFVCSWGYDQTNIDYYKVLEVKNKSVVIAGIGQNRTYTGHMQGECSPVPNAVSNKRITKRIIACGDSVSLKMTSYSWAYPWSGKTNHFTEWA
jgi:hypothetical protein